MDKKICSECNKPLKKGEPAVLPLYCPFQPFHLDCLFHKLMKSNTILQKRVAAVKTRQKDRRFVEIEIGRPGTYNVDIRTIKLTRMFQIKADKLGNVGLFV